MLKNDVSWVKYLYIIGKILGITPIKSTGSKLNKLYSLLVLLINIKVLFYGHTLFIEKYNNSLTSMKMLHNVYSLAEFGFSLASIGGHVHIHTWRKLMGNLNKLNRLTSSYTCTGYTTFLSIIITLGTGICLSTFSIIEILSSKITLFSLGIMAKFFVLTTHVWVTSFIWSTLLIVSRRLSFVNDNLEKYIFNNLSFCFIRKELQNLLDVLRTCKNVVSSLNRIFGWCLFFYVPVAVMSKLLQFQVAYESFTGNTNFFRNTSNIKYLFVSSIYLVSFTYN